MPFGTHTTHQIVRRCERFFMSRESHLTVVHYKVLTKLRILNDRFFKDRNIGKFVRNTKINQRKLTSCLIGTADNKFEIVILTTTYLHRRDEI